MQRIPAIIDDALVFDIDSITVEDITEFNEYHCLHISAVGYLDRTRIPVGIDIGFGDMVYPDAVKMEFPVILDMKPPTVNSYSLESSVAKKLEAIIQILMDEAMARIKIFVQPLLEDTSLNVTSWKPDTGNWG